MSDDGEAVVGDRIYEFAGTLRSIAVIWTSSTGIVELGPRDGRDAHAAAITPDGTTVIGSSDATDYESEAPMYRPVPFMWRSDVGFVDIVEALSESGVDLAGWQLGSPQAVSANGRVIVGSATCGGLSSVYRLVLPR